MPRSNRFAAYKWNQDDGNAVTKARGSSPDFEEGVDRDPRSKRADKDGYQVVAGRARGDAPGEIAPLDTADRYEGRGDPFAPMASDD